MASHTPGETPAYYIPHEGWYPVWLALSTCVMMLGLGSWLNTASAGEEPNTLFFWLGFGGLAIVLFQWFAKVVRENHAGLVSGQLKRSYVWGMGWFIFSEVMFFAAFFGALFYARNLAVAWLGGDGAKGITGDYLWPEFENTWPVVNNPNPEVFTNPGESMAPPSTASAWAGYLPLWNTVILLTSSVTVHFAHTALKNDNRNRFITWLGLTVALGIIFLILQGEEYIHAYQELGLTLESGIYGSTFFILTGFHGFHVTLGTFMLAVQLVRAIRGHFSHEDCFGFEASSWYWHFVDVVWVGLFFFVYLL
ncbi:MAG: cytochrome c oxidase subunit 3 [Pseudomonadota bacterium]